jgi:hypothetical protein
LGFIQTDEALLSLIPVWQSRWKGIMSVYTSGEIDHFSRRSSLPELSLCAECHGGREDLKVRARKGLHLKTELVFKFSEPALLAPACEEEAAILQSRCCICSRFLLVPNKCSSQMWKNS